MKVMVGHPCRVLRYENQDEEISFGHARGLRRHRLGGAVDAAVIDWVRFESTDSPPRKSAGAEQTIQAPALVF